MRGAVKSGSGGVCSAYTARSETESRAPACRVGGWHWQGVVEVDFEHIDDIVRADAAPGGGE